MLDGQEAKAKDLLLDAYKQGNRSHNLAPDIPYMLAVFDKQIGNAKAARDYLCQARDLYAAGKTQSDREKMLLTKRIADCYYSEDNLKSALKEYNAALTMAHALPDGEPSAAEILEGMVACETDEKNYPEAEKHSAALVTLWRARMANGGIYEFLNYAWALLQSANLYQASGQTEKLDSVRKENKGLMTALVEARMTSDAKGQMPDYATMVRDVRAQYVQSVKATTPAEIAWAAIDFKVKTLPIIAWKNKTPKPVAAVLCIHGMGLENRSFEKFAADLNARGYLIYAMDVRGFGSWTQTKGEENLDYKACLADIKRLVLAIKERNPGLPLYVLGESMGGAIALRAGAQLGDLINGVISSVPSCERFQAKRMSLQTAMHFMIDPHRPFDVGSTVTERATSEDSLRTQLRDDPKAKMGMTPIELMQFALFMRMTKPQAERITKLPVLMAQGLQDQLVKPQGTFDLFDAVKSTDKTFLIIGKAEHLMFENNSPDQFLMDSLDSWLRTHSVPPARPTTP
jgi:acylglycerol lipase